MEIKENYKQQSTVEERPSEHCRKRYVAPELQEWGSIQDLTLGPVLQGFDDFPAKGGTLPA